MSAGLAGRLSAALAGLAAVGVVTLLGAPASRVVAVPAALAVLAAVAWRSAATVAGCLIVMAAATAVLDDSGRLGPAGLAVTAVLLALHLVLADEPRPEPADLVTPVGTVAVAVAVLTVAGYLPTRSWLAPVGIAGAAAVLTGAAWALRGRGRSRRQR